MRFVDDILTANIYSEARDDGFGHTVVLCCPLDEIKPDSNTMEIVIKHVIQQVAEALKLSKKKGHHKSFAHIYMGGCFLKNYSAWFYHRLVKTLNSTFEDTLEAAYVYNAPPMAKQVWNVLKFLVDPDTRQKIHIL